MIEPCFADPNNPSAEALCIIMEVELEEDGTCPCTVNQNSAPESEINSWFNNCYYACRNHYHPDFVQE